MKVQRGFGGVVTTGLPAHVTPHPCSCQKRSAQSNIGAHNEGSVVTGMHLGNFHVPNLKGIAIVEATITSTMMVKTVSSDKGGEGKNCGGDKMQYHVQLSQN